MTAALDPVEIDAYAMILHAARLGMPFERYKIRVESIARKKIKKLSEGLKDGCRDA